MVPARTTQEAYRNCDAETPLPPDDDAYVDLAAARNQDENFATKVAWIVEASATGDDATHIGLISGHRGCGKSTELLRVRGALEEANWAVAYFDAFDLLDQNDLEASDVMIALCEEVAKLAQSQGKGFNDDALRLVYDYFAVEEDVREDKRTSELQIEAGADLGGGVPHILKLFAKFRADMKGSEEVRHTYRRKIEKNFSVFSLRLKELVRSAESALQRAGKKGLVVIVDSLEKLPYSVTPDGKSSHERFFELSADALKCPPCRVFYTVPITLTAEELLSNTYGDTPLIVPMIDLTRPESHACLCEVLERRIDRATVFEPSVELRDFVDASGGCVRDLLRLVRQAVLAQTAPVKSARVAVAVETLVKEYDRLFDDADIPTILACGKNGRIDYDEVGRKLLYRRVILEYENGRRRMAPHPLVERNDRIVAASQPPAPQPKLGI